MATESYQEDLASIRRMMDRSSKFISLTGLSGILSGGYALAGTAAAWAISPVPMFPAPYRIFFDGTALTRMFFIALLVLVASLATGFWLSHRKARKAGVTLWNDTTRRMLLNLAIPLVTGGIFILLLVINGNFTIVSPSCLIFYGLALIQASPNLFEEVRFLGYSEIVLGLICALLPGYGLLFWATGFGVFHILYGTIMYRKYDA